MAFAGCLADYLAEVARQIDAKQAL